MAKKGLQYPDTYGTPIKGAMELIMSPLNMDEEGDVLVPRNDMKEVGGKIGDTNYISPDPLDLIKRFGDGTKG
jgi:hypothetical protein